MRWDQAESTAVQNQDCPSDHCRWFTTTEGRCRPDGNRHHAGHSSSLRSHSVLHSTFVSDWACLDQALIRYTIAQTLRLPQQRSDDHANKLFLYADLSRGLYLNCTCTFNTCLLNINHQSIITKSLPITNTSSASSLIGSIMRLTATNRRLNTIGLKAGVYGCISTTESKRNVDVKLKLQ